MRNITVNSPTYNVVIIVYYIKKETPTLCTFIKYDTRILIHSLHAWESEGTHSN